MKRAILRKKGPIAFITWRYFFVLLLIGLLILALVSRVVFLTLIKQSFLRTEGDARTVRVVAVPAFRGMILDRNGRPLAVSAEVYSVWVNPQEFEPSKNSWSYLRQELTLKTPKLLQTLRHEKIKGREFYYLKRGLDPEIAEKLKKHNIAGLYVQREFKRFYPEGEIMAQVLGFTNVDDHGQEGMELAYNDWLQGVPGKKVVLRDRLGHVISDVKVVQDQRPGQHLTLSIDSRIQYLAYRELMKGVKQNAAQSATAIVLNAKTGEILAMVNYPSFNPNHRTASDVALYRNNAITDVFEPGSTMKSFTAAFALDSGKFKPETMIDTSPGFLKVGHNLIKDHENLGTISLTQILQKSSNVGNTKVILALPPQQFYNLLHRVGFGESTGVEFPGEQMGVLVNRPVWSPFVVATMGFGYGISVTPIQLARAYAVFANHGQKLPLTLLRREGPPPQGEQAITARVADQMLAVLESVLEKGGTGEAARVHSYRVAGKTGTSRIAGLHGYKERRYQSTFVGIAPISHPSLVVAVVVHDPKDKYYYGGQVSGPIFSKIMEGALRVMNVEPDAVAK